MKLTFVELSCFEKYREEYLPDDEYRKLQASLLENPRQGNLIQGTGGLRKIRVADTKRNQGKRGGARIIYYLFCKKMTIYFLTIYGKDVKDDLSPSERKMLSDLVNKISEE